MDKLPSLPPSLDDIATKTMLIDLLDSLIAHYTFNIAVYYKFILSESEWDDWADETFEKWLELLKRNPPGRAAVERLQAIKSDIEAW